MKKLMTFAVFAALIGWSQQIDSVTVRQRWPWSKLVDINYVLTAPVGQSYDVTVQAFNGEDPVTIPSSAFAGGLYGVTEGAQHIVLDPSKIAVSNVQMLTQFKVQLIPAVAPLYMIVDLTKTAGAEGQIEYVYEEALTNGIWGTWVRNPINGVQSVIWTGVTNDIYKTDKLVLRRIRAGTFGMGDAANLSTTLTKDFYAGVFEVTQGQWEWIKGTKPSYFNNSTYYATRPVEQVTYNDIRGATNSASYINWPLTGSLVLPSSFIGNLRVITGMEGFDLPTDAQWEYLCRAGATTVFSDGNISANVSGANANTNTWLAVLGRYQYNGGKIWDGSTWGDPAANCTTANATMTVGSYLPNAWGVYDTHGNVWEWCLDWTGSLVGGQDPVGASSGLQRVRRGGAWGYAASYCRSAFRNSVSPAFGNNSVGFRLVVTLP